MKKKILGSLVAAAIAVVAAINVNFNNEAEDALSALSLANVEALADGENDVEIPCVEAQNETCTYNCKLADGTLATCTMHNVKKV